MTGEFGTLLKALSIAAFVASGGTSQVSEPLWIAFALGAVFYLSVGVIVGSVANPLLKRYFPTHPDEVVFWTGIMALLWPITLIIWWCDG